MNECGYDVLTFASAQPYTSAVWYLDRFRFVIVVNINNINRTLLCIARRLTNANLQR